VLAPLFADDAGFLQDVEDFAIQVDTLKPFSTASTLNGLAADDFPAEAGVS